ncbi:MAG: 2Fe-2S iron-sulfur cluster-binding protein [Myxococcota bacterium]
MKSVALSIVEDPIEVVTEARVLDALIASETDVLMACGGKGICATCHVYVESGAENLTPMTAREKLSLKTLSSVRPNSRLACQARIVGEGVQVALPGVNYLVQGDDLITLIGRRTDVDIVHPVNGSTLVQSGKIITRSRIEQLKTVDTDVAEMRARSMTL